MALGTVTGKATVESGKLGFPGIIILTDLDFDVDPSIDFDRRSLRVVSRDSN